MRWGFVLSSNGGGNNSLTKKTKKKKDKKERFEIKVDEKEVTVASVGATDGGSGQRPLV